MNQLLFTIDRGWINDKSKTNWYQTSSKIVQKEFKGVNTMTNGLVWGLL